MVIEFKFGVESGLLFEDLLQVFIDQMEIIKMVFDDFVEISFQLGKDDFGFIVQLSFDELMVYF